MWCNDGRSDCSAGCCWWSSDWCEERSAQRRWTSACPQLGLLTCRLFAGEASVWLQRRHRQTAAAGEAGRWETSGTPPSPGDSVQTAESAEQDWWGPDQSGSLRRPLTSVSLKTEVNVSKRVRLHLSEWRVLFLSDHSEGSFRYLTAVNAAADHMLDCWTWGVFNCQQVAE